MLWALLLKLNWQFGSHLLETKQFATLQVKALKSLRSIMHLIVAIRRSLSAILQVFMLILVVFFMFAYMGVQLFGQVKSGYVYPAHHPQQTPPLISARQFILFSAICLASSPRLESSMNDELQLCWMRCGWHDKTMQACRRHLNYHTNFENFGSAMLVLVRVSTSDAWAEILSDLTVQPPLCDQQAGNCGQSKTVVSLYFACFIVPV